MLDAVGDFTLSSPASDGWGLLSPLTSCGSYFSFQTEFSSKLAGWGGPRPNSGGARENSGGARAGAGRPRKVVKFHKPNSEFRWYVARTFHGQTALADRALREAGYTIFAPTIFKPATSPRRDSNGVMRPGKPDRVDYLFVRYIIVSLNLADPGWRDVVNPEFGVERIICGGHLSNGMIGLPIAVPDAAVDEVRELLNENDCLDYRVIKAKPFDVGTKVRFTEGAMLDREAVVEMSDGARVMLLLNLLGRPIKLTVEQSAVEPVG